MGQLLSQLIQLFNQYTIRQKLILTGIVVALISTLIAMLMWANRTEYELLYSGLEPAAASAVVSDLRSSKVPYRLEAGGTTIYAPRDQISELRLKYVQAGFIKDAVTGYEVFEENTMGMTTFMQQLNMKRALEGELMRTINQFPEVSQCRVHLVIPESRLFESDEKGSASVVLHIRPGRMLNQNQLGGIASLVANSVEGIDVQNVVVMDAQGNVLIDGEQDDELSGKISSQNDLRASIESQLRKKVKTIVEGVVGQQNAKVEVAAELDFDQYERTTEEVDPDKSVVLSEEKYTENSQNAVDSSDYAIEKATTNYELTKKKEHFVSQSGGIKRLTVAVLVNGRYVTDPQDDEKKNYEPRSAEELEQLTALVRGAIGFHEERGDQVEVQNMQFQNDILQMDQEFFSTNFRTELIEKLVTYGITILGLLLAFFMLKGFLKSSVSQLALATPNGAMARLDGAASSGAPGIAAPQVEEDTSHLEDSFMHKLSPEARAKLKANDKMTSSVIDFADKSPENTAKLMRSWLSSIRIKAE